MDKIKSLILSTNPDDKLLAIHLLDNLSDDKWQIWVEENMRPGGNITEDDTWHHCNYVLEFENKITLSQKYLKGAKGYYYLAGHCFTIEFEENAQFWIRERRFVVTDL